MCTSADFIGFGMICVSVEEMMFLSGFCETSSTTHASSQTCQIQEWARDYDSNDEFNHISQLYPLFPGAQIDPRFNTTLTNAAKVTLQLRGDSSEGWPTAWRANFFSRLLDGETAYHYMQRLLSLYSYDNLWSINSVFQVNDGNFGELLFT
ncbi:hypothetical protein MPER_01707, partial [Moniliophthora perniciosa FA553]